MTKMVKCRVMAIDLRGHGSTKTEDEFNLSAEQLSKDVGDVIKAMYGDDPPPVILMGHSMGGAIAVHTAHNNFIPSLIGLVVIDVVEGTALEALSSMQSFLRGRPKTFTSLENAIEWWYLSLLPNSYTEFITLVIGGWFSFQREERAGSKFGLCEGVHARTNSQVCRFPHVSGHQKQWLKSVFLISAAKQES